MMLMASGMTPGGPRLPTQKLIGERLKGDGRFLRVLGKNVGRYFPLRDLPDQMVEYC